MLVGSCLESIFKEHIRIKRIILRTCFFLCYRVIKRSRNLGLVGEELAQLYVCREAVSLIVVLRTLGYAVFKSAESVGNYFPVAFIVPTSDS